MRHRKSGRKLNMDSSARKAMFRNMVTSLMIHGQIRTTTARAKELRRVADKVISIGKRAPSTDTIDGLKGDEQRQARADRVAAIRRARLWVNNDDAITRLFGEYADRFRSRPGGYTRIIKAGFRAGDNADMAIISLTEAYDPEAVVEVPDEMPVAATEAEPEVEETPEAADDGIEDDFDDAATVVMAEPSADEEGEAEVVEEE